MGRSDSQKACPACAVSPRGTAVTELPAPLPRPGGVTWPVHAGPVFVLFVLIPQSVGCAAADPRPDLPLPSLRGVSPVGHLCQAPSRVVTLLGPTVLCPLDVTKRKAPAGKREQGRKQPAGCSSQELPRPSRHPMLPLPPPAPDALLDLPGPPPSRACPSHSGKFLPFRSFWSLLLWAALLFPGSCFSLGDPPVTGSPCGLGGANLCEKWGKEGRKPGQSELGSGTASGNVLLRAALGHH